MTTVTPTTLGDAASQAAQARLTTDTQSFLKLLTAQLANQDPMAPVDATQWVSQLAQFSSVEQAVQSNGKLADVLQELRASSDRLDLAYLGKQVEIEGNTVGLKDGKLTARYTVPDGAAAVEVRILDDQGRLVRTVPVQASPGTKTFTWDGKAADGTAMPDGPYVLDIGVVNAAGKALDSTVTFDALVKRVRRDAGETLLRLDTGVEVNRDAVVSAG